MAECILYYITDRCSFRGDEREGRSRLLDKIAEAADCGVDYVQLREKDLTTRELEGLAREAVRVVRENRRADPAKLRISTSLLINSRTDVALAVGAAGVHLRGCDVTPQDVRTAWTRGRESMIGDWQFSSDPIIGVSCHSPAEARQAATNGATFAVFGAVFEKKDSPETQPAGFEALRQACREKIPVLALGGISAENARSCLEAGAAGIAAIRLFQENDIASIVRALRG